MNQTLYINIHVKEYIFIIHVLEMMSGELVMIFLQTQLNLKLIDSEQT